MLLSSTLDRHNLLECLAGPKAFASLCPMVNPGLVVVSIKERYDMLIVLHSAETLDFVFNACVATSRRHLIS